MKTRSTRTCHRQTDRTAPAVALDAECLHLTLFLQILEHLVVDSGTFGLVAISLYPGHEFVLVWRWKLVHGPRVIPEHVRHSCCESGTRNSIGDLKDLQAARQ
jgi:hypothetical protein